MQGAAGVGVGVMEAVRLAVGVTDDETLVEPVPLGVAPASTQGGVNVMTRAGHAVSRLKIRGAWR